MAIRAAICLSLLSCALFAARPPEYKLTVTSPVFAPGAMIPERFTCDGNNISPPLQIGNIPPAAKALVLILEDPDAPGGLFTHWLVWNLSARTTSIREGGVDSGMIGKNDFGQPGYGGPCPPSGTHRYIFRLFALDSDIKAAVGSKRADVDAQMRGHVIGRGELMGRYAKKK